MCVCVCVYRHQASSCCPTTADVTVLPLKMCRRLRRNLSADHAPRNLRHGLVELGGSGGLGLTRGVGERRGGEGERKYSSAHTLVRCVRRSQQKSSSVFSRIFACNNNAGPPGKRYGLVLDDNPAYTACQTHKSWSI